MNHDLQGAPPLSGTEQFFQNPLTLLGLSMLGASGPTQRPTSTGTRLGQAGLQATGLMQEYAGNEEVRRLRSLQSQALKQQITNEVGFRNEYQTLPIDTSFEERARVASKWGKESLAVQLYSVHERAQAAKEAQKRPIVVGNTGIFLPETKEFIGNPFKEEKTKITEIGVKGGLFQKVVVDDTGKQIGALGEPYKSQKGVEINMPTASGSEIVSGSSLGGAYDPQKNYTIIYQVGRDGQLQTSVVGETAARPPSQPSLISEILKAQKSSPAPRQGKVGDIVSKGGKKWKIIGYDKDNIPLVDPAE